MHGGPLPSKPSRVKRAEEGTKTILNKSSQDRTNFKERKDRMREKLNCEPVVGWDRRNYPLERPLACWEPISKKKERQPQSVEVNKIASLSFFMWDPIEFTMILNLKGAPGGGKAFNSTINLKGESSWGDALSIDENHPLYPARKTASGEIMAGQ